MKIVVSGSDGNLGREIIKSLSNNHDVIYFDLDDREEKIKSLKNVEIDYFFHFGEFSKPDQNFNKSLSNLKTTIDILEKSFGYFKIKNLVYASSHRIKQTWENHYLNNKNLDFSLNYIPDNYYGNYKLFMENHLRLFQKKSNIEGVLILRIGSILGQDSKSDSELENEFSSFTGKMSLTRILKKDFIFFIRKILTKKLSKFDIVNIIPEKSILNLIFNGKNFNNY